MRGPARYPDGASGPFPAPPLSFVDGEGREVTVRPYDAGDREALVEMYRSFDPGDRAQGIPPTDERRIRDWLDTLLAEGANVLATHGGSVVGHATLVPDCDGGHELAIFVLQSHQGAGVGRRLLRGLLGHGERAGVERVWLSVERWNAPALALYRSVGFETTNEAGFELEMALRLH